MPSKHSFLFNFAQILKSNHMKHIFTLILFSFLIASPELVAQEESKWPKLDKSPLQFSYYPANVAWRNYLQGDDRNKSAKIKVTYSSPAVAGREIFGDLVPFGEEWRVGANEATEVIFYRDVEINGKTLNRGVYTMFATVNEKSWTINFSTEAGIWGGQNRDVSKDVARIEVPTVVSNSLRENLAIGFREIDEHLVHMVVSWYDTSVNIPIAFNVVSFPDEDVSPGDLVQYPDNSRFRNYLKPEELDAAKAKVRITYGRPMKKGREIFGGLIKYGEVWRLGANESTEMTLYQDVNIGGETVKSGRYNLYAIPTAENWTVIFSTDRPAWGAANRDEEKDAYKIKIPVTQDSEVLEALGIRFEEVDADNVNLIFGWDTTRATMKLSF